MRLQVLGLLRFSYPSEMNGEVDIAAKRAELYDPERLKRRMVWFRHVVLPCVAGQTDPDHTFLILCGDQFPEPFRSELLDLCDPVPQIKVVFEPEGQVHRLAVNKVLAAASDPEADCVAEYLLDDDDAVGFGFVELSRSLFPDLKPIFETRGRAALDFCYGAMLYVDEQGYQVRSAHARLWVPGLMYFRAPKVNSALRSIVHLHLWKDMPVLSVPKPLMFVRGVHEDNISRKMKDRWTSFPEAGPEIDDVEAIFQKSFGIDLSSLAKDRAALGP